MEKPIVAGKSIQILEKAMELVTNFASSIVTNAMKKTIKRAICTGSEFKKKHTMEKNWMR